MSTDKGRFRVFFPEDFPLLPIIKSRFIGAGTFSVEEAADSFGAAAKTVYKMLNGDQALYANVEWGLVAYVVRKNPALGLELLQQFMDAVGLPYEVRYRTHPKIQKSLNAICEQLQIMFKEAGK